MRLVLENSLSLFLDLINDFMFSSLKKQAVVSAEEIMFADLVVVKNVTMLQLRTSDRHRYVWIVKASPAGDNWLVWFGGWNQQKSTMVTADPLCCESIMVERHRCVAIAQAYINQSQFPSGVWPAGTIDCLTGD